MNIAGSSVTMMNAYWKHFQHVDSAICVKVNHISQYRLIRYWFRMISRLGDGVFWYTLMALIVAFEGRDGLFPALHMALAGGSGTLIYKWIKGKTLRPRPYQVHQDIWLTGKPLDHFSFPSGHTLHAVAFTGVALFYFPLLAGLLIPFTVMVGMSRVILGLHYPSDVLAGAIIGTAISSVSITLLTGL